MSVSLSKGASVSLTKAAPGLTKVFVGLGWDARTTSGADFDLDAVALVLGNSGKVLNDQHFIFFNNLKSPDGTIEHTGDNLDGEGDGDDEVINVNLQGLSPAIERIVVGVAIYDAVALQLTFGQVQNAFIRVVNAENNTELARYDLSEDASVETAMVFGELFKDTNGWNFRAVGQGYAAGLGGIAAEFGVNTGTGAEPEPSQTTNPSPAQAAPAPTPVSEPLPSTLPVPPADGASGYQGWSVEQIRERIEEVVQRRTTLKAKAEEFKSMEIDVSDVKPELRTAAASLRRSALIKRAAEEQSACSREIGDLEFELRSR